MNVFLKKWWKHGILTPSHPASLGSTCVVFMGKAHLPLLTVYRIKSTVDGRDKYRSFERRPTLLHFHFSIVSLKSFSRAIFLINFSSIFFFCHLSIYPRVVLLLIGLIGQCLKEAMEETKRVILLFNGQRPHAMVWMLVFSLFSHW